MRLAATPHSAQQRAHATHPTAAPGPAPPRRRHRNTSLLALAAVAFAAPAVAGDGGLTDLLSLAPGGGQGNAASGTGPVHALAMTPDARHVAFVATASNLVPGDTNNQFDVFRLDRLTGTIVRCNLGPGGVQSNNQCYLPDISADGAIVAWNGSASNLVPGDVNGFEDVFVRDVAAGTTELVSVNNLGVQGNLPSQSPSLSGDGRYVAFWSGATNLAPSDGNGTGDIFVRDRLLNRTLPLTILPSGIQANANSGSPSINRLGTHVVFRSSASNLVFADTNGVDDLFLYDLQVNTLVRVAQPPGITQSNGDSAWPTISTDATVIAFESDASNLVPGDTNGVRDVFVQNLLTGVIRRASVDSNGVQGDAVSDEAHLSADGQHVVFSSVATNLVANDTNGFQDVFVHHLATGVTARISRSTAALGNANQASSYPVVSADGLEAVFTSAASNLVSMDTNLSHDVFVRRWPVPPQLVCTGEAPGAACPCGNTSPAGSGGGCRNSTSQGARPSWVGSTGVASDDATVLGSGLVPAVPCLLFSGPVLLNGGAGAPFGDGLRCAGGPLQRLGVRFASGAGTATWGPGLAALAGWSAGETQIVQIWYRDVPGLCGPGFNTSSALEAELFP